MDKNPFVTSDSLNTDTAVSSLIKQENWNKLLDFLYLHHDKMNLRNGNILQRVAESAPNIRQFISYFPVDMTDEHGRTASWWAAFRGKVSNLRALLEAGAEPNLADHKGLTPMFVAATPAVVTTLHEFGGHLNVFDKEGTPLLDYVERSERQDVANTIRMLQQEDYPVSFTSGSGNDDFTDRFEPFTISPRELVNQLDANDTSLRGIIVNGERYSVSNRFLKGLVTWIPVNA